MQVKDKMKVKSLLKGIKKPRKVEFVADIDDACYGKFVAEPFSKGFGVTVGNSIRRALMSSIEGTAITAIKIEGVLHEFGMIDGMLEDLTTLILNFKKVRASYDAVFTDEPKIISIERNEAGVFRAADLAVDSSLQILNPELYLATFNEDIDLKIDIQFDRGRGYVSSEQLARGKEQIGTIAIDSLFSPIQKANYEIVPTRVGQLTDYERLELEVWTDGSISPRDAVAEAAKILKEHLTIFINFEEEEEEEEEVSEIEERLQENLRKHVEELGLSVRSLILLNSLDLEYLFQVVKYTREEMKRSRHYSVECLDEIIIKLSEYNLELGMHDIFAIND